MNESASTSVSREVDMRVVLDDESRVALPATLSYDAHDPYAVTATFSTADGEIAWVFARELLESGLSERVGDGDIVIRPAHPSRGPLTLFTLSSPSGSARIEGNRNEIRNFLEDSYDLLPVGSEWQYLQVDRVIDELLAEG